MAASIITAARAISDNVPASRIIACAEWSEEAARLSLRNAVHPELRAAAQSTARRLTMQAERLRTVATEIEAHGSGVA